MKHSLIIATANETSELDHIKFLRCSTLPVSSKTCLLKCDIKLKVLNSDNIISVTYS